MLNCENVAIDRVIETLGVRNEEENDIQTTIIRYTPFYRLYLLTQVVTNLVENAIKYNREHGKVTVTLDADHQYFTITVEDTGIGIPEESLNRIYDRFYRVDKSHSREIGGTGLGLAITKEIIKAHNENINVVSTEGVGSEFTFSLSKATTDSEQS